ncbi:MAG: SUMF1/EgtB/PvdO family nonheme iron enzyme, partial [Acidobacteria bacterium]|nr:SUMF1/EgtB/PvdO family nonheme iron enzyme [Acidobacteriota bacterium]
MNNWIVLTFGMAGLLASGSQRAATVNSLGMRMVRVEAGSFVMGQAAAIPDDLTETQTYNSRAMLQKKFPTGDPSRFKLWTGHTLFGDFDERPAHRVRITKPFQVSAFEVTNAQYEQFDPAHRALRGKYGFSKGEDEAVVFVTWNQAKAFTEWLSKKEGKPYRLPTEAEWEYAARAGTSTLYSTGDSLPAEFRKNVRHSAYDEPADLVATTVGKTPANPWGLYDMHGNVEEWCLDWYGAYDAGAAVDPVGRASGDFKVTRGGSHGTPLYY